MAHPGHEPLSRVRPARCRFIRFFQLFQDNPLLFHGWRPAQGKPVNSINLIAQTVARFLPYALGKSVDESGLEKTLTELVKLRASQINGCAFCLQYHLDAARKLGVPAEKLDLVAACRRGFSDRGVVVVAGSVDSSKRIADIRAAGADAFTIGTAAIDETYAPGAGPLLAQLKAVLEDCGAAG